MSWKIPVRPSCLGLDRLPALTHATRGAGFGVAEHMRVATDELGVHRAGDAVEIAVSLLLEQEREEVDLEEQVAELVVELRRVVGEGGVGDLVRLLDGVGDDRASRLLAVPRAFGAQAPGQRSKLGERRVRVLVHAAAVHAGATRPRWSRSLRRSRCRAARSPPRT